VVIGQKLNPELSVSNPKKEAFYLIFNEFYE
jgi:hypothetical protein